MQETQKTGVWSLGQEDPLEEEAATQSSILAWKIPRTEKPGGLQYMSTKRHTWVSMHICIIMHIYLAPVIAVAATNASIMILIYKKSNYIAKNMKAELFNS